MYYIRERKESQNEQRNIIYFTVVILKEQITKENKYTIKNTCPVNIYEMISPIIWSIELLNMPMKINSDYYYFSKRT